MPWESPRIQTLVDKAISLIHNLLAITPDVKIYLATLTELKMEVLEELKTKGVSKSELDFLEKNLLDTLLGKYFPLKHEIWILEGDGEQLSVVIHELLHSIQKCHINREGICDYLTYLLTQDTTCIDSGTLQEWREIEKANGISKIKSNFIQIKDCEDF